MLSLDLTHYSGGGEDRSRKLRNVATASATMTVCRYCWAVDVVFVDLLPFFDLVDIL